MLGSARSSNGASRGRRAPGAAQQELWRKWFDATVESWEKSAELGEEMVDLTPRWLRDARAGAEQPH